MKIFLTTIAVFLLVAGFFAIPSISMADENIVCAAVMPCDNNGGVTVPYNQGDCAEVYAQRCQSNKFNKVAEEIIGCTANVEELQIENKELKAKLIKLQRKLRQVKSRSAR